MKFGRNILALFMFAVVCAPQLANGSPVPNSKFNNNYYLQREIAKDL